MPQQELSSVYITYYVDEHEKHKERILSHIDDIDSISYNHMQHDMTSVVDGEYTSTSEEKISATDYSLDRSEHSEYMKYILENTELAESLLAELNELGYIETEMDNYWFQQYHNSDTHAWHTHGKSHWAVVYYVELPESAPPTHIRSPHTGETIVPDVGEGGVLVIPAQVIHRSPPNQSNKRKTIVAFNLICSGECH